MKLHREFKRGPFQVEGNKIVLSDLSKLYYVQKLIPWAGMKWHLEPRKISSFRTYSYGDDDETEGKISNFTVMEDYCQATWLSEEEHASTAIEKVVITWEDEEKEMSAEAADAFIAQVQWEHFFHYREEYWRSFLKGFSVTNLSGESYQPLIPAIIVPLDHETVETLFQYQKKRRVFITSQNTAEPMSSFQIVVLKVLEEKIDRALSQLNVKEIFVKTSTRSPKDVFVIPQQKSITQPLKRGIASLIEPPVTSMAGSAPPPLICGKDAVRMLATSNRVFYDLECYLLSPQSENMSVIVKPYVVHDPQHEYRCFVHCRKLTAISQYGWHPTTTALPLKKKYQLKKDIEHFMKQMIHALPFESVVVDLYCDPLQSPILIECKPFSSDLGIKSSLFDWFRDRFILYHYPEEEDSSNPPFRFVDENI